MKTKILLVAYSLFCLILCSCVFDPRGEITIKIFNYSNHRQFVDEVYAGDDSDEVMNDSKFYCSGNYNGIDYPEIINPGDSSIMYVKTKDTARIDAINVDSLMDYCHKKIKYNIANKSWVKIVSSAVDLKKNTCTIVIR